MKRIRETLPVLVFFGLWIMGVLWCVPGHAQTYNVTLTCNPACVVTGDTSVSAPPVVTPTPVTPIPVTPPPVVTQPSTNACPSGAINIDGQGSTITQLNAQTFYEPATVSTIYYYTFTMGSGQGLATIDTAEYQSQPSARLIVLSAQGPCGAPAGPAGINNGGSTGAGAEASISFSAAGSYYNVLGYLGLTVGSTYTITVYQNSAYPPTPANTACQNGTCEFILSITSN